MITNPKNHTEMEIKTIMGVYERNGITLEDGSRVAATSYKRIAAEIEGEFGFFMIDQHPELKVPYVKEYVLFEEDLEV